MQEFELIAALQKGDTKVLEQVIDQFGGYVMAVVQHVLGLGAAQQDKEELVADVFVSLWKNAASLKDDSHLKAWLAVVARNSALNWARSNRPTLELQEDFFISEEYRVETPLEQQEQAEIVREAVETLRESDRDLFLRYYYYGNSITQIAEDTGMNPSTIKSRLFRGRQTLKTKLTHRGYTL